MSNLNSIHLLSLFIEGANEKLRRFSPQLYLLNGTFPRPYASSVLVKVKQKRLMVTAAHVLEGTSPGEIKISSNNEFITLHKNWHYLENDKLDLAVMEIDGDLEEALCKNFDFYNLSDINPDHEAKLDQLFFTFGYPNTKTKVIQKLKKVEVGALVYIEAFLTDTTKVIVL